MYIVTMCHRIVMPYCLLSLNINTITQFKIAQLNILLLLYINCLRKRLYEHVWYNYPKDCLVNIGLRKVNIYSNWRSICQCDFRKCHLLNTYTSLSCRRESPYHVWHIVTRMFFEHFCCIKYRVSAYTDDFFFIIIELHICAHAKCIVLS